MNVRLYKILMYIYESPKGVKCNQLSNKLCISDGLLYSDLTSLNENLIKNKVGELKFNNHTVSFLGDEKKIIEYLKDLDFYEYTLTKEERVTVETLLLLVTDKITLNDMANVMMVSRSTVISDQKYLKEFLEKNDLRLYSKSSYGLELRGEELKVRELFIKILLTKKYLLDLFCKQKFELNGLEVNFCDFAEEEKIQNIIRLAENRSSLVLTGHSNWILKKYIKFFIYRSSKGKKIKKGKFINKKNLYDKKFIKNIYPILIKEYGISENIYEIETMYYLSKFFRYTYSSIEVHNGNIMEIQTVARLFIEKVSSNLDLPLYEDDDLFEKLFKHLERTYGNQRNEFNIYPDVKKIVLNNEEVYIAVKNSLYILENYHGRKMEETEIAYIVVYICMSIEKIRQNIKVANIVIVCNSGYGTSELLKYKLEEYFLFNIYGIYPAHKLEDELLLDIDFIISTVDLNIDFPYIKISPLLDRDDILKIEDMLIKLNMNKKSLDSEYFEQNHLLNRIKLACNGHEELFNDLEPIIFEYVKRYEENKKTSGALITEEFIKINVEVNDWEEAIIKASEILVEKKYITEEYVNEMIVNYKKNGPYFVVAPHFAMPHAAIDKGSLKRGLSLIRLENPVVFNAGELDPVKYICIINAVDEKSHVRSVFKLIEIFRDDVFVKKLDLAESAKEVEELIIKYSNSGGEKNE